MKGTVEARAREDMVESTHYMAQWREHQKVYINEGHRQ